MSIRNNVMVFGVAPLVAVLAVVIAPAVFIYRLFALAFEVADRWVSKIL